MPVVWSHMVIHGDCVEKLKELEPNSVDAIVTDPPYFLTNGSGSGFMGKEWDSLSVANAFAESILRSLCPVWLMAEESSAQGLANTKINSSAQEKNIHALYVQKNSIDQSPSLNLGMFSVQESVLTKAEVLALSSALCPNLTSAFENQPPNVLYVVPTLFQENEPINIVRDVALRLVTAKICEELKTLHLLMGDPKTNAPIEAMAGNKLGSKFISATSFNVKSVESIVAEKRYSVTISSPIEYQKTIRWITSLRFVRNAMALFTENPGNIQILSERFHYLWAKEVFRVLKPGAHVLAFAGTRTYHPLANAIQGAGFEIRDQIQWLYGSGFPKSHDISKAIDKAAGAEREVTKEGQTKASEFSGKFDQASSELRERRDSPATDAAKTWQGFGTALKPANEPIVLARKPIEKGLTVAENVLKYGTGALNIDGSRIAGIDPANAKRLGKDYTTKNTNFSDKVTQVKIAQVGGSLQGRWPANILLDEQSAQLLDEQSGVAKPKAGRTGHPGGSNAGHMSREKGDNKYNHEGIGVWPADPGGGASRFFYVAKASKRERNAGLEGMPDKELARSCSAQAGNEHEGSGYNKIQITKNNHPTVKPVKLMEYLCKLITPPKGIILDPFMGSGSTGVAAKRLGFQFIGIEMNAEYLEIAKKRMEFARERSA